MSTNTSNHLVNPAAREAMDKFKMEAAAEVGVNLKNGYNGELTSRQAGSVGGQMVKKMIEAYENGMKYAQKMRMRNSHRTVPHFLFRSCFFTGSSGMPQLPRPCTRDRRARQTLPRRWCS